MPSSQQTLGQFLISEGLVNEVQVEEAIQAQVIFGGRLGTNLIELGYINIKTLAASLSKKYGFPTPDDPLNPGPVDTSLLPLIPKKLAQKWGALPWRMEGKRVAILMSDPSDFTGVNEIGFAVGKPLKPFVIPELVIFQLLEKYYGIKRDLRYISLSPQDTKSFAHDPEPIKVKPPLEEKEAPIEIEPQLDVGLGGSPEESAEKMELKSHAGEELSSEDDFEQMMTTYQSSKPAEKTIGPLPKKPLEKKPAGKPPAEQQRPPQQVQQPSTQPPVVDEQAKSEQVEKRKQWNVVEFAEAGGGREPVEDPPVQARSQSAQAEEFQVSGQPLQPPQPEPEEEEEEILEDLEVLPLTLEEASEALKTVENRDELAEIVLGFAMSYFKRAALLITRQGLALGWDGMGGKLRKETMQGIMIPLNAPSIFKTVFDSSSFYLGPIPKTPLNDRFIKLMGGEVPRSVFLIPILFGGKVVNILYGDNGHGENAPVNISDLLILAPKVPQAFGGIIKRMKEGLKNG